MKSNELGKLLGDFRLLAILFVFFRLMMLISYEPFLLETGERGIGVGGDRQYHYALASLSDDELYPFRDWWSEFPPIWYLTTTGIYHLMGQASTYNNWSLALGLLLTLSELGILIVLRQLGTRLHNQETGMALAWIYALFAAPAIFMWWNFDSLVTFFLLLGILLLLKNQDVRSATVVALGALTKFVPFLLFGAIFRFYSDNVRRIVRYLAIAIGLFVLAYLPLFALNADFAGISLTAQFDKPSYQTVWALIDGNTSTGNFGTLDSHLSVEGVQDGVADRNPPVIPSILRFAVAGLIGLFVFLRTRRMDEIGLVAFVGITLTIFYLQSQGWSPQWLTQIIPLMLLVFPSRNGVLVALLLSVLAFLEYPFIFLRSGDGIIRADSSLYLPWVFLVMARTMILVGLCVAYYRKLRQQPNPALAIPRKEQA